MKNKPRHWVSTFLNERQSNCSPRTSSLVPPSKPALNEGSRRKRYPVAVASSFVMAWLLVSPQQGFARPPVPASVFKAVRAYWRTTPERIKAFDVIACETGGRYNTTAVNGQYLGLFQMGSFARARYGHGSTARSQARAAHAYYVDAGGWGPWSCG